tara:strand:+ start:6 stop:572 length:567 start_codon:yes stop_codon:yes gene_type:complete
MNTEWVFPTEIWNDRIEGYKSINRKLCKASMNLFNYDKKGRKKSNYGGWHSDFLHNYEYDKISDFDELIQLIQNKLNEKFGKEKITDVWININKKNSYNLAHCHSNCLYSGVYYIKVPENSGDLVFLDPYKFHNLSIINDKKVSEHSIISEEGVLWIFRGWLPHKVKKNLSNDDRISLAFNCKGKNDK